MSERAFTANATTGLSVSDTTGSVVLADSSTILLVQNKGAKWVYFKLGDSAVTATTSDTPLGPGAAIGMDIGTFTYIAAICDSTETSTLKLTSGAGHLMVAQAGEVAISGITVTTDTQGTATAAAPSYSEGTSNDLSMNLAGDLRTISKQSGTWTVTGAGGTFPVTGTFYQATQPVSIASAAVASGAFASGSIASGAIASGAVASGAVAAGAIAAGAFVSGSILSGALASGAVVDLTNLSTPITPATATATKGALLGIQYNSTQATFTNGQQGSVQGTARGALYVATGADAFAVTLTSTTITGTVAATQSGTWNIGTVTAVTDITNPVKTRPAANTTGTQSIVASSASDVTILASNANRLGATVFNDSTQILYLLLSNATSSATVYSVQLGPNAYYEVPFGYSNVLKGIWAAANGNARVTEITA